jgi:RNA polymerase sigma-70 factor, ECF subfamily
MKFVTFDSEYVQRLAAGDADTERHFVAYFGELLRIKLRAWRQTPQLVEEIRQEVFLRVFRLIRRPGGVREPERLGALVNAICDNVIREFRKAAGREPALLKNGYDRIDEAMDVETELLSIESSAAVRQVLGTLSSREQLLLRAVYFEETEKDEICREQGVEREYLRVLLHRARNSFRERYLRVRR